MGLDFEGILNYFRVSLPRKFQSEEDCKQFFQSAFGFKVREIQNRVYMLVVPL